MNAFLAIPVVGEALAFLRANRIVAALVGGALVLLVALGLWFGLQAKGRHDQKARDNVAAMAAISAAEVTAAKATGTAATERQIDHATTTALQQELSHADDAAPDSRPSPARVAYLCGLLRSHTAPGPSKLPAACGPDGAGTPAAHR